MTEQVPSAPRRRGRRRVLDMHAASDSWPLRAFARRRPRRRGAALNLGAKAGRRSFGHAVGTKRFRATVAET
jgi:hypothetical protein